MTTPTDKAASAKAPKQRQAPPDTKVVVRTLPPNLPEQIFWDSVAVWVNENTCTWKQFWPGKIRKGVNKENLLSRAYIAFRTPDQAVVFSRDYDGHIFRDKSGNESAALVEFAPYQKVPPEKKKADQRSGTIKDDEDYKSFIASLEAGEPTESQKPAEPVPTPSETTTTPLLAALLAEKQAKEKEKRQPKTEESASTRKRLEQKMKDSAADAIEFSRKLNVGTPAAEPSSKAKEKSSGGKSTEQAPPEGKKKGASKAPPSPAKASKVKAAPTATPTDASTSTQPPLSAAPSEAAPMAPKPRPKFKFDAAIPGASNRRTPATASTSEASTSTPATPSTETPSADGPAPLSRRQKQRLREQAKKDAAQAQPESDAPAAVSGAPVRLASTSQPKSTPKPVARIDDVEETPASAAPQAGIIPVQITQRGRGRGGGGRGRGGGGRGKGRGAASAPTPT